MGEGARPPLRSAWRARARTVASVVLVTAIAAFGLLFLVVVVGTGVHFWIGSFRIRSTMAEFPAIGFLVSLIALLVVRSRWREAVLLCASLAVTCGLLEVGLRLTDHTLSRPPVKWFRASDWYGHELVPGFTGPGPLRVPIAINAQGFRDREHPREKEPGVIRVLGLGDSFTFGWGVPVERTFLRRLEEILGRSTGRRIDVINAGVPGWGLNQHYIYLKRTGMSYHPDFIAVAYFVDDISLPIQERVPPNPRHQPRPASRWRVVNLGKSLSALIAAKNRTTRVDYLHDLTARRQLWLRRSEVLWSERPAGIERPYRGALEQYLRSIQQIADAHGSTLVLMLIPDVSQLHHPETQHINRVLSQVTSALGIPLVDMTPRFEQAPEPSAYYLWPRDAHANAAGHEEMARALADLICRSDRRGQLGGCGRGRPGQSARTPDRGSEPAHR